MVGGGGPEVSGGVEREIVITKLNAGIGGEGTCESVYVFGDAEGNTAGPPGGRRDEDRDNPYRAWYRSVRCVTTTTHYPIYPYLCSNNNH